MAKTKSKNSPILSGIAGEYFVAAELSRRGFIATVTLKNTRGIDILVSNVEATKTIGIQVKTNHNIKKEWMLNEKAENFHTNNLFYIFVNLVGIGENPEYYIVPSNTVAKYVKSENKIWLDQPGKKGQKRNKTPMRMFRVKDETYLNKWGSLEL